MMGLPQGYTGAGSAIETFEGLQERRQAEEQHQIQTIFKMATMDPKGAEGAWNRSYLGLKYGNINYAGAKGDWVGYRDGSGKLYSMNRSTGEFKEGIGEGRPEVGKSLFDRQIGGMRGEIVTDLGHEPRGDEETETTMQRIGIAKKEATAKTAAEKRYGEFLDLPQEYRDEAIAGDPELRAAIGRAGERIEGKDPSSPASYVEAIKKPFKDFGPSEAVETLEEADLGAVQTAFLRQERRKLGLEEGKSTKTLPSAKHRAQVARGVDPETNKPLVADGRIRVRVIAPGKYQGKTLEIDEADFDPKNYERL